MCIAPHIILPMLTMQLKNQHMRSICRGQESYTPPLTEDMSTAALGGAAHAQYMFNRRNTYWHCVDGELVEWLVMLSICWTLAGLDLQRTPFPAAILASDAAMAAAWTMYMVSACSAQAWCSLPGGTQPTLLLGIGPGAHTQHMRAAY